MTDLQPEQGHTRRRILGGVLGGLGVAAASPLAQARAASSAAANWSLRAAASSYTFPTGAVLPFDRFEHSGAGTTHGAIPVVEATEGDTVVFEVENNLPSAIRPALIGAARGPLIRPGHTAQFSFTMPPAGSYLIGRVKNGQPGSGPSNPFGPPRATGGLSALAISRPASGANELWSGGPTFDREYFLLYEDADDRRVAGLQERSSGPREPYHPNYFLVNGMSYPDIVADADSVIAGNLGERILIRLGNLGRMRQAIHFHGYHPEVVARNNVHETILGEKDTVPVPYRTTTDVILTANQIGTYPLHPHSLTAVTANGFYPMGQLTLITIS